MEVRNPLTQVCQHRSLPSLDDSVGASLGPAALYPIRLERASFADNPKEATASIESRDSARVGSATHKALNRVTSGLIYVIS